MADVKISGLVYDTNDPTDGIDGDMIAITDGTTTKRIDRAKFIGTKLLAIKSISSGGVIATDDSGNPGIGTVSLPLTYTPASKTVSINVATSEATGVVSYDDNTIKKGTGNKLFANAAGLDHGSLAGLGDNDHPQYRLVTVAIDHGSLTGLGDNDHPQYLLTTGKAADSDKLDGYHSSSFSFTSHNHNGVYLPTAGKAADSDKLDGYHASSFATTSHTHAYAPLSGATFTGAITIPTTPTNSGHAASKSYVDTKVASSGNAWGGGVSVSSTGVVGTKYLQTGWTMARSSTGQYVITHGLNINMGISVVGQAKFATLLGATLTNFTIQLYGYNNTTKQMGAYDASFWFTAVKVQ